MTGNMFDGLAQGIAILAFIVFVLGGGIGAILFWAFS